ncbi:MAG TPA: Fur family transcriptional regulator [Gaiellaceae bacterium]|nr:Fur family transcriptional regulator [Gaiellaceae bacterium]
MSWSGQATAELRRAGYRPGGAGTLVLDYLEAQSCCRGAQEIYDALTVAGRKLGLASVYRMLERLDEHGLVQRIDVGDGIVRYEPARAAHHHHLVCAECGKVEPFADQRLEQAIEAVEERSGYSVVGHEVVLRGACAACRPA